MCKPSLTPKPSQTEPEAREKFGDDKIKIYKSAFTSLYYSMMEVDDKEPTAYKLICAGPEEKVVGLHLIGVGSDEMLQGFAVAIKMGGAFVLSCVCLLEGADRAVESLATKADFDSTVAIHPTSAEGALASVSLPCPPL